MAYRAGYPLGGGSKAPVWIGGSRVSETHGVVAAMGADAFTIR